MVSQSRPFNEIFDLLGVRVIVPTKADCYRVLGVLHDLFTPVHERFKDYIATPKGNMYQSLHTTVIGPEHKMVEIQIRTGEMHKTAELGIAAHYSYKEGKGPDAELDQKLGSLFGDAGFWSGDTTGD
ncbi:MAG: GTP pyrophosphokinase, partial [bacterium]